MTLCTDNSSEKQRLKEIERSRCWFFLFIPEIQVSENRGGIRLEMNTHLRILDVKSQCLSLICLN